MKKIVPIGRVLTRFSGEPLMDEGKPMTLRDVLLSYLSEAGQMELNTTQKAISYAVGMLIGTAGETVSLSVEQYDVLKRICDHPEIKIQTRDGDKTVPLPFKIFVTQQVKELVDGSETVNDSDMMAQELQKRTTETEKKKVK